MVAIQGRNHVGKIRWRHTRLRKPPAKALPAMSCDCHLHVFGDPAKFPDRHPNPVHPQPGGELGGRAADAQSVGFGRGVFVQPANYITDHSYLLEALAQVPHANYRATGIIDDSVEGCRNLRLHEAGMRGVRFNFVRRFNMAPSPATLQSCIDRIRPYGWYIKIFIGADELPDHIETFRKVTAVPVVIDHMGRLRRRSAASGPRHVHGPFEARQYLGDVVQRRAHVGAATRLG